MTRLLVSVRSAAEAEAALAGGAAVIDVKEPARGALGRADDAVIADVVRAVAGRAPVSAALGELRDRPERQPAVLPAVAGLRQMRAGRLRGDGDWWRPATDALARAVTGSQSALSDGGGRLRRLAAGAGAAAGRGAGVRLRPAGLGPAARHLGQGRPDAARLDEPGRGGPGSAASAATPA